MSKVDICREILAARTLHAENDSSKDKVEKLANPCTNHDPRNIFLMLFLLSIIKYIHGKWCVGPSANAWYFGESQLQRSWWWDLIPESLTVQAADIL